MDEVEVKEEYECDDDDEDLKATQAVWPPRNSSKQEGNENVRKKSFLLVMKNGAKGCEVCKIDKLVPVQSSSIHLPNLISSVQVIVSGKLRAQPVKDYIDSYVRHVLLRQGVLGIKVKIMLDWDPKGKQGPVTPLPDLVTIHHPKEEEFYGAPPVAAAPDVEVAMA